MVTFGKIYNLYYYFVMMVLSVADLQNSSLYLESIVEKQIILDGETVNIIEGIVTSFNMHKIIYSYNPLKNHISISYFDKTTKKAVPLVEKRANSLDDFDNALINADKNLYSYLLKN